MFSLPTMLRCSGCGHTSLDFSLLEMVDEEVTGGKIICPKCSHMMPVVDGVIVDVQHKDEKLDRIDRRNQYVFHQTWSICPEGYNTVKYTDEFDVLTPMVGQGGVVLDAGCGSGRLMDLWAEIGAKEVVFVDVSDAVFIARNRWKNEFKGRFSALFIKADLKRLPLADNVVDSAVSVGVIHHTTEQNKAVQSISRVTRQLFVLCIVSEKVLIGRVWIAFNVIKPLVNRIESSGLLRAMAGGLGHLALFTIRALHFTGLSRLTSAKDAFAVVAEDRAAYGKIRFLMLDLLTAPFYKKYRDEYYVGAADQSGFDLVQQVHNSQCEYFKFMAKRS